MANSYSLANMMNLEDILNESANLAFRQAKRSQGYFLCFQALIFIGGILGSFVPLVAAAITSPVSLFIIFLGTGFLVYSADKNKELAELLLRQHEYWDGFGLQPPSELFADLVLKTKGVLQPKVKALLDQGLEFASKQPVSAKRCLENLIQSSWFTRHLSFECGRFLFGLVAVVNAAAIASLLYTLQIPLNAQNGVGAAQCACAAIAFIQGVGLISSAIGFYQTSTGAMEILKQALCESRQSEPDRFKVQRLLSEYQIIRSNSPLIPDWIWMWRRNRMNEAFEAFKIKE